ncbi:CBD9-like protein [Aspergillus uvarum CBS 121591]|uniref:CBD9-like protein n=1 Tax=Aspergillus uvarum CBS 121591 TaxID=1448315 RepID=A0A319CMW4_9EURO|nr:CBD9-like protein [Aspergillus uvarum CBS 121591]PYH84407.1 CBD9-like protein [Aspergillus uvarum CBS 121591]
MRLSSVLALLSLAVLPAFASPVEINNQVSSPVLSSDNVFVKYRSQGERDSTSLFIKWYTYYDFFQILSLYSRNSLPNYWSDNTRQSSVPSNLHPPSLHYNHPNPPTQQPQPTQPTMHLTRKQWLQALTLALLPTQATAKILTTAPDPTTPSLTYSITIPNITSPNSPSEKTPSNGPIYLRLTAPTTMQWLSLGQGPDMATANIFIVYAASATTVTLSPRSGGQGQPSYNPAANVTLLEGSGIVDGVMVAEVRCENCWGSWPALSGSGDAVVEGGEGGVGAATGASGGSGGFVMDANGNETAWFWAYQLGAPLDSADVGAELGMHDVKGEMVWDLREAGFELGETGLEEGFNPFV